MTSLFNIYIYFYDVCQLDRRLSDLYHMPKQRVCSGSIAVANFFIAVKIFRSRFKHNTDQMSENDRCTSQQWRIALLRWERLSRSKLQYSEKGNNTGHCKIFFHGPLNSLSYVLEMISTRRHVSRHTTMKNPLLVEVSAKGLFFVSY